MPPLLVTFGLSVIIQNGLLQVFTADNRRLEAGAIEVASCEGQRRDQYRRAAVAAVAAGRSSSSRVCNSPLPNARSAELSRGFR